MESATTIHKQHIWTFTRSTGAVRPSLENEGLVLRASWNYRDWYFQVWEPEVADLTKVPPPSSYSTSYSSDPFFKTAEGAPCAYIYPDGPANSNETNVTGNPTNIDWVATKNPTFQIPKVIYYTRRYGWGCEIISQLPGNFLQTVLYGIIKTDDQEYLHELPPSAAPRREAEQICTRIAVRVADAIVEMSTWQRPLRVTGVSGIDGGIIPDPNLWENHIPLTQQEINQNLDYTHRDGERPGEPDKR